MCIYTYMYIYIYTYGNATPNSNHNNTYNDINHCMHLYTSDMIQYSIIHITHCNQL